MWNIDIENRVRDMNAEAESRHAGLLDTMTKTDGSAKSGRIAMSRLVERVKQAFNRPRPLSSRQASLASGK